MGAKLNSLSKVVCYVIFISETKAMFNANIVEQGQNYALQEMGDTQPDRPICINKEARGGLYGK
jgi:hypothetical protein